MLNYNKFFLENGLTVLFIQDKTTPLAVVNTIYDVGARDESKNKTGFAHLFEHLMFGGSINISDFDTPLQLAGGENNAFTSNDITNYYNVLPAKNIETALWLESDRMLSLSFTQKSLDVQKNVVIEEFKQRYLNQPYGDVWLELRPLTYRKHPYQWATIGKEISHIENATITDVKSFFTKHYSPSNAILCIAGDFELNEVKSMVKKWYNEIPAGQKYCRNIVKEPKQKKFRKKTIYRNVPANSFYYAFKMPGRLDPDFLTIDVISDALGRDKSSRLYNSLKKELKLVSSINSFITGSIDDGLLIISGKLNDNISFEKLDKAIWEEINLLLSHNLSKNDLNRIMNKIRTSKEFENMGILNQAMNLCYYELLGDADMINKESNIYNQIEVNDINRVAKSILKKSSCSLLKVRKK
ncbi:MAG: peptidase M16 [Crocinitomicaceae bacterium]|nr:peptidase M16 [Crocinitomicaceae bacterium]|tara:strand:+ start:13253 stop:14488 length:1236 start_codon:yes stop_codon:yes gene_type:complete